MMLNFEVSMKTVFMFSSKQSFWSSVITNWHMNCYAALAFDLLWPFRSS